MPTPEKVKATHTKSGRTVEVDYNFGANLDEMAQLFGPEVVYSQAKQAIRISLQARLRSQMDVDEEKNETPPTDKQLQESTNGWKPGVATSTRKSPAEKAKDAIAKLSPEERKALMAQLSGGGAQAEAKEKVSK